MDESEIIIRLGNCIVKHAGPAADAEIAAAESTLGVRFPNSYRVFLKRFGAAWLATFYEIAGLGIGENSDPQSHWLHVVDMNLRMRRYSSALIPSEFIRICDNGGDYSFHLDTRNVGSCGECPVVVLGPGRGGVVVALTFVHFVELAAVEKLEY